MCLCLHTDRNIHEDQTKAILVANRAIIGNWTLAVGDDGLGFAFAMPIGIIGNAFTRCGGTESVSSS